MKILNLYCGIGGNRKLWTPNGNEHEITAVELNPEIAKIYQDFFPNDKVIVADAHQYLLDHYKEFDFIWSSPPCPSHSDIRRCGVHAEQYEAIYPDRKLWEEIILLQHFAKGKWVIENVRTYYKPFVTPKFELDRHYFWANFYVPKAKFNKREELHGKMNGSSEIFGVNLNKFDIDNKRQLLRNMVNPEVAKYILNTALNIEEPIQEGLFAQST